jgi:hypothetical protein
VSAPAWLTYVPLALALAALGLREGTRVETPRPEVRGTSSEVLPTALELLGSRAPGVAQRLDVVPGRSRIVFGPAAGEVMFAPSGQVETLPRDEGFTLTLQLERQGPQVLATRLGNVTLRVQAHEMRRSAVPGVLVATLRGRCAERSHAHEVQFEGSWMRLPGGGARLQGVIAVPGMVWEQHDELAGQDTLALDLEFTLAESAR